MKTKSFTKRNNSIATATGAGSIAHDSRIGNFGYPVNLATPKDFTLTPVDKLKPMGYDMNKLPKDMRITSDFNETDIPTVR